MAMQPYKGSNDVMFNSDLLNEQMLERWSMLKLPKLLATMQEEEIVWLRSALASPDFERGNAAAFYDEAQTRAAIDEASATVSADPEFQPLLTTGPDSGDTLKSGAFEELKSALLAPSADQSVAENNRAVLDSIKMTTDTAGVIELNVGGVPLLRANTMTASGKAYEVAMKVAVVFIDIVGVVMAAVGIAALKGNEMAKRFVAVGERITNWFLQMMERFWARIKGLFPAASAGGAALMTAVKGAASKIGEGVVALVTHAKKIGKWEEFKAACSSAAGAMINTGLKRFLAICQLVAAIILLCVSGGTTIVLKIIQLVALMIVLVVDSYTLYKVTHAA
jgi:hypothetical protein